VPFEHHAHGAAADLLQDLVSAYLLHRWNIYVGIVYL
jgi:hypothetical protein